ncbi:MAG: SsrA-binding protein SmpB [Leptospiraceae bacterium]|nr:SsrA-binding protein SmpB [Leptospiraceae bacterium]MCB1320350.1 SsrA-binding protein SmpB [Leptospiraceae bacterium]
MAAGKKQEKPKGPPSIENKKARHNYEILETIEAGIALLGTEVKSLRAGQASMGDAYAVPRNGEMYLVNLHIQPYQNAGAFNHEETRSRRLLLKKSEIQKYTARIQEKRLTMVPLKLYFNQKGIVKVLLGLGRGKKLADHRETEKKTQAKREIERALRDANR